MSTLKRYLRNLALATATLGLVAASATTASATTASATAGAPTTVTLNPPPPDTYTCKPFGEGTRCTSDVTEVVDPVPSGIVCGTGSGAFEVMDQGTRRTKATRWYGRRGNLTKRVRDNIFSETMLSNPLTGASVPYVQHDIDTDLLATPGDLSTATTFSVESLIATAPGYGVVLVNRGRSVYGPDGSVLVRTGRRDFDAYFGGDTSVVDDLCAALGG